MVIGASVGFHLEQLGDFNAESGLLASVPYDEVGKILVDDRIELFVAVDGMEDSLLSLLFVHISTGVRAVRRPNTRVQPSMECHHLQGRVLEKVHPQPNERAGRYALP